MENANQTKPGKPNYFDQTEDRILRARERILSVTLKVRQCVNAMDGPEPLGEAETKKAEAPTSYFAKIGTALQDLENTTSALEHEASRLMDLFG